MNQLAWSVVLIAVCTSVSTTTTAVAADRAEYNRRSAERYIAMFRVSDFNEDNIVTRHEARVRVELTANFDDIDINRDGNITWAELTRYIAANFQ